MKNTPDREKATLFCGQLTIELFCQGEQHTAYHIAQGNHDQIEKALSGEAGEGAGYRPVVHIRNGVLGATENENRNAQENGKIFAQLMRVLGVAVDGQVNKDVANAGQQENAPQTGGQLCIHHGLGGDVDSGVGAAETGEVLDEGQKTGAHQVANPDHCKGDQVAGLVVKEIAGLSGEQIIAPGADGKQADAKQNRAHNIRAGKGILDPEEYGAAQADADARKYGVDKGSQIFFHNEPSFFLDVGNTAQRKNAVMR